MVNFFNSNKFNRLLLSGVLVTFSMAVINPSNCHAQIFDNFNVNDIAFGVRIEKLIQKVWKYKEKGDSNKLLDVLIDIKNEVEDYTGNSINIDKQLD